MGYGIDIAISVSTCTLLLYRRLYRYSVPYAVPTLYRRLYQYRADYFDQLDHEMLDSGHASAITGFPQDTGYCLVLGSAGQVRILPRVWQCIVGQVRILPRVGQCRADQDTASCLAVHCRACQDTASC